MLNFRLEWARFDPIQQIQISRMAYQPLMLPLTFSYRDIIRIFLNGETSSAFQVVGALFHDPRRCIRSRISRLDTD